MPSQPVTQGGWVGGAGMVHGMWVVLIKVLGCKGVCHYRGDVTECGSVFATQGGEGGRALEGEKML